MMAVDWVGVHPDAVKLLELAKFLAQTKWAVAQAWGRWVRRQNRPTCDSCSESWCCRQLVMAHLFEGVLIADRLLPRLEALQAVSDQGRRQRELLEARGADCVSVGGLCRVEDASREWFERGEECALLDGEGRCSCYDWRPVTCAGYLVMCPADHCSPAYTGMIPAADHGDLLQHGLMLDARFAAKVAGRSRITICPPMPLGEAVALGFRLLAHGRLHATDVEVG